MLCMCACIHRSDEAARSLSTDLASTKQRLAALETALRTKERDAGKLGEALAAAQARVGEQAARNDEFVKRVEGDLALMRSRALQVMPETS